jgi:hypothetical protein
MTEGKKIKGVHFVGKGILNVCDECTEYKRFVREMDKEENEFFEFCKRVRADPQGYLEGRIR